ncbi:MAG TPA: TonB-dependent receptor, partial [Polyangiaceae bacterium]|nr:TonB-dependent receptor [Polyangiaceae bacterium]
GSPAAAGDGATTEPPSGEAEVRVEEAGLRRSTRDRAAASTVLGRAALSEPGVDVARLLARVPGAQSTRTGASGELATVSLRGASAAEVPVYLAGVRVQDELTGVTDLSRLPLWMMDRMEVYRGSTPDFVSHFGLGGALVLEPRVPRSSEARGGMEVGSWDSQALWLGASASNQAEATRTNSVGASTSLGYRAARATNDFSYHDDGGTAFDPSDDQTRRRSNADFTSGDLWSVSRFVLPTSSGPVRTDVVLNAFGREQGVTSLAQLTAQHARMQSDRWLGGLTSRVPCQGSLEDCQLTLATRAVGQRQLTSDPWGELGLGTDQLALGSERVETRASLRARTQKIVRYGADVSLETGRVRLEQPGFVRTRAMEQLLGLGGVLGLDWGKSELQGVGRATCLDVTGTELGVAREVDTCFGEGRLGGLWQFSEPVALRANVLRAVRPPTLGERYGVGPAARGNSDLEPESNWAFDLGLSGRARPHALVFLEGEVFGFARFAEDLIAYRRSALGYVRPYNVAEARTLGVELALAAQLLGHLRLSGQLTALDPRDTTPGRLVTSDLIPLLSRLTWYGELESYVEDWGLLDRAWLTIGLRYRGGRVADPAGLIVIGEQLVTDLTAGMLYLERHVAFRARLENLFDVAQFDTVGYPLPGRSVYGSLELSY